jgi:nicotinamidase-related amidase
MSKKTLICVDVQNDYFPGGLYPLEGATNAATNIAAALKLFRQQKIPIIHIRQMSLPKTIPFLIENSVGSEIHESAAPLSGEILLHKRFPNSFRGTGLKELLDTMGINQVYLLGFMSQICIDATTRQALDYQFKVSLIPDACAAAKQVFQSQVIEPHTVHACMMASLQFIGCELINSQDLIGTVV